MKTHQIIRFDPNSRIEKRIFKINTSVNKILSILHSLEDENRNIEPSYNRLKELCLNLISRVPLPVQYLEDTFILRGRENKYGVDKSEVFSKTNEISYNSKTEDVYQGRFNKKGVPVFYGSAPFDTARSSGQITAICEMCKELFDVTNEVDTRYFTIGKWDIVKPVNTVILTFDHEVEQKSQPAQKINPHYLKFLKNASSKTDLKKCAEVYSFFSGYAARKCSGESQYIITTAFFDALKEYYGDNLAILYSSSMTDNYGLNIALSKETVDNGFVKLNSALMFKVKRSPNDFKSYGIGPATALTPVDENNCFTFKSIW